MNDRNWLGYSRVLLGAIMLARTTPISRFLPWASSHVAAPLFGWPEHGFHAAWGGVELPIVIIIALCFVRTAAALLFTFGVWTRAAGTVTALTAFIVVSQDAFAFKFTLYTLFVGVWLVAISGGGRSFAMRPSKEPASPWLVRVFVASVYAWAAIAKLRVEWLDGETLNLHHHVGYLTGSLADLLLATSDRCRAVAWSVLIVELALAPLLLARRTRWIGLALAIAMHVTYEFVAKPDVFGWVMLALLLSFFSRE